MITKKSFQLQKAMVALAFLGYMFVLFEPAPYDIIMATFSIGYIAYYGFPLCRTLQLYTALIVINVAAGGVSLVCANDPATALVFFSITTYLMISSLALSFYIFHEGENVIHIIFQCIYFGVVCTFLTVILAKLGHLKQLAPVVIMYEQTRVRGFFKDTNVMGPALIPVCLYAAHMMGASRKKWIHCMVLIQAVYLIVLSFSRGAVITLVIASISYQICMVWGKRSFVQTMIKYGALAGISGIITVVVLRVGGYLDFLSKRVQIESYDHDRFEVYRIIFEKFAQNPLGIGPGETNPFLYANYDLAGSNAAHETYLRVLFENGVLGFLCFITLIGISIFISIRQATARHRLRWASALSASTLIAVLVSGLTVDTLHWRHLWLALALVWGVEAYRFREKREFFESMPLAAEPYK